MAIVNGTNSGETLNGTVDADNIYGLNGADIINAGAGADLVYGDGNNIAGVQAILDANPGVVYNSATGTFYQYVDGSFTVGDAKTAAESSLINGVAGHLATISSLAENDFVANLTTGHSWIDGSDTNTEGTWEHHDGTEYWNGGTSGSSTNGAFSNWFGGAGPTTDDDTNDYTLLLEGFGDSWYAFNDTYEASYVIEWEIDIADNDDAVDEIYGEAGDDTIYGEGGDDILDGGADNDDIYGGEGNDAINAGTGDDEVHGGKGNDDIVADAGADTISGDMGNDTIDAGGDNDVVTGGAGSDDITGGDGDDILRGHVDGVDMAYVQTILDANQGVRFSADTGHFYQFVGGSNTYSIANSTANTTELMGVAGHLATITSQAENDFIANLTSNHAWINGSDAATEGTFEYTSGAEAGTEVGATYSNWFGGAGPTTNNDENDNILLLQGNGDTWYAFTPTYGAGYVIEWELDTSGDDNASDTIDGGTGNDQIFGAGGDDVLVGGEGNDTIDGGEGNDQITSGTGDNVLTGGEGNDTFVIGVNAGGSDIITDMNTTIGTDVIDLSAHGISDFADITINQTGSDAELVLSNGQTITLANTDVADVTEDSFVGVGGSGLTLNGTQNEHMTGERLISQDLGSYKVVDYNGDGVSDVVSTNGAFGQGLVWFNGTDGVAERINYMDLNDIDDVDLEDFNGDGHIDIGTTHLGGYGYYDGTSDMTELTRVTLNDVGNYRIGDINNDGNLNIVSSDGAFGSGVAIDGTVYYDLAGNLTRIMYNSLGDFRIGDVDGDGANEIVSNGGAFGSGVAIDGIAFYELDGAVTRHTFAADANFVLGQTDGDSALEVVTNNAVWLSGANVTGSVAYEGGNDGTRITSNQLGTFTVGDVDGDGIDEIISTQGVYGGGANLDGIILYEGDGTNERLSFGNVDSLDVADFDGDGQADILASGGQFGDGLVKLVFEGADDNLVGGAFDDTLNGGEGDDILTGGNGSDTFIFEGKFDNDEITDFELGVDILQFIDVAGITSAGDVMSHVSIVGSDSVIDIAGQGKIVIIGQTIDIDDIDVISL